ncbi:MAG: SGNH/GDSL hydrolase family protein [Paludibacteraceae bacterium]|nr:SGNH/GDSL hydrolase family protein [Paludibacteraceae bacterium]
MKLVALGDSIIKGVLVQSEGERSRYSLADKSIVECCAEKLGGESLNLGKMGCTIEAGERILNRYLDKMSGAQYVLLEYGGNDSDYNWQEIAEAPEKEHFPRTRLEVFEQVYERVINKIKEMGAIPLVLSLPPMDAERYFAFFSQKWEDGFRANVMHWLGGSTNTIMSGHELYNLATMRIAQRTGAQWIDVTSGLLKGHNFRAYLCDDGIHPNERGQRVIAEAVLQSLR